MKPVIDFLKRNGFKEVPGKRKIYSNGKCKVVILYNCYEIINKKNDSFYSEGLSIYWLIGVLTFYNFIKKDYK